MTTADQKAWEGFVKGNWCDEIDVRDFIQLNYTPYEGDASFLAGPTEKTLRVWNTLEEKYLSEERKVRILDVDTDTPADIDAFKPGYICEDDNVIVGLQTDAPLKRAMMPNGGWRMVETAIHEAGKEYNPEVKKIFTQYRKTHNDAVFDIYTPRIRAARSSHIITGLPDAYGRGRIIGDYRRVALYGVDHLIAEKQKDKDRYADQPFSEHWARYREEHSEQIKALKKLKNLAASYGYDISGPATNAHEAVQWTYFGYLASVKSQDGAAMSIGRLSGFFDCYFERDLKNGTLDESGAQEIIDALVIKLRITRFLRTIAYDQIFSGDPYWATWSDAGFGDDGRTLVTKTSFRLLQTLVNLGPAPEPNITIFWDENLPRGYKEFCARISIETSSIQYESDPQIRAHWGDDAAIACCVSPMKVGKQMQFFGARANLAKLLLMSLNGGKDEKTGLQVGPEHEPYEGEYLEYDKVLELMDIYRPWLAKTYVNTMNIIHYMHDKYAYEKTQMALHDTQVHRFMAFGAAGLSVLADSLSAIKYAKVRVLRNSSGMITGFETTGEYPAYGNDDDRVDQIACEQVKLFYEELKKNPAYRGAEHTLSILTITSNVVYGRKTGATPDGRKAGEPFAPGANPMHGREKNGALASLNSVAKIPYEYCRDGISNTFSIIPQALGKTLEERCESLVSILDGYFAQNAHHINVNVMNREMLVDAYNNPDKYPNLTIRVSGYAVNFHKLTKEQQREVISRTFHQAIA